MIQLFSIIVLIFSAIIHEYMHGWMAERLGDDTAKDMGRLSLNPLVHIDIFGSVILPLFLVLSGSGVIFGWAKPVPVNPNNIQDKKWGMAKVSVAGPLGNLIIAIFLAVFFRIFSGMLSPVLAGLIVLAVFINLILMVFNLVPIPPLDGSKILAAFLPYSWQIKFMKFERYGMFILIVFIFFAFDVIMPVVFFLMNLLVGEQGFLALMQIY
ncbi:site-2 protease family protein [bacterium]|nr:site-2 protease family protein [bacterium]